MASRIRWRVVVRNPSAPERIRHHAEHRAAVEALEPAFQQVAAEPADLEALRERHESTSGAESARGSVGMALRRRRGRRGAPATLDGRQVLERPRAFVARQRQEALEQLGGHQRVAGRPVPGSRWRTRTSG